MNYGLLAQAGRNDDSSLLGGEVAHLSRAEADLLEALGGAGTINPVTGLPEYYGVGAGGGSGGTGGGVGGGGATAAAVAALGALGVAAGMGPGGLGMGAAAGATSGQGRGLAVSPSNSGMGFSVSPAVSAHAPPAPPAPTAQADPPFGLFVTPQMLSKTSVYAPPIIPQMAYLPYDTRQQAEETTWMQDLGKKIPKNIPIMAVQLIRDMLLGQTKQNVIDTTAWLGTPQGQASLSPGSTGVGGQARSQAQAQAQEQVASAQAALPEPLPATPEPFVRPAPLKYTPLPYPTPTQVATQGAIPQIAPIGRPQPSTWPLPPLTTLI